MKEIKKIIQIVLVSTTITTTLILTGCSNFSETDVEKPIKQYLKEN